MNACINWSIQQRGLFNEIEKSKVLGISVSLCQVLGSSSLAKSPLKNQANSLRSPVEAHN